MCARTILFASLFLAGWGCGNACDKVTNKICGCEGDLAEAACDASKAVMEDAELTKEDKEACKESLDTFTCDDFEAAEEE